MVRPSTQIFFFPVEGNGHFKFVAGGVRLDFLIGETLAALMTACPDPLESLQLVRLRYGATTIVAHKRLHDIKVTLTTYHSV